MSGEVLNFSSHKPNDFFVLLPHAAIGLIQK